MHVRLLGTLAGAHPCSPSSCTLSHKLSMSSQFSPVRFSSVVFAGKEFSIVSYVRSTRLHGNSPTMSSYGLGWPPLNMVKMIESRYSYDV